MAINLAAIYHEAKSKYAYAFDEETIHIRLRTAKNDVEKVYFIYGDPFNWSHSDGQSTWCHENPDDLSMIKEYSTKLHDYWFISVKPKYRRMKYSFVLENQSEKQLYGCRTIDRYPLREGQEKDLFNYFNFPFLNSADVFKGPNWVKDTVWYQIFPERFCNGDESNDPEGTLPWGSIEQVTNQQMFGGDLAGVIKKLDHIQSLGATGIYFTPIFKANSNHKYDTADYFQIDPQFGDLETVKKLVKEAHKRGIRVMLDAVFNHCGWFHPFFQDVLENGENSPYKDYFHIKEFPVFEGDPRQFRFKDGESMLNFDTFAFTPFMPKWNTEHPEVKDHLLKVAQYWITECDIDAWRLDVSNEVDHQFWRAFRKACDEVKKDFYILGENWDDSNPWLQPDQMHSVMNYSFTFPTWNYFGRRSFKASDLEESISHLLTLYPKNISPFLFNLLDSHDTTRVLSVCKGNKELAKLTYVFLLSFGGTPSIYYGSEVGLLGEHDPDNRRCMIWDEEKQDLSFFDHIKRLIECRKQYQAFREVDLQFVEANDETNHIVYKKQANGETFYFIINNHDQPLTLELEELKTKMGHDVYHHVPINLNHPLMIKPYGFLIIKVD
jgi:cyclomaltodextrinase / maltogenic alpha-amylase / neopullulanase